MTTKEAVQEKEETIRALVRDLPDGNRAEFHEECEKKLKDPDTYAVLNYVFIASLHHFYLGKWLRGFANLLVFWAGVFMLFSEYHGFGIFAIVVVSVLELNELFRSQIIVQDYNNRAMEKIYHTIHEA